MPYRLVTWQFCENLSPRWEPSVWMGAFIFQFLNYFRLWWMNDIINFMGLWCKSTPMRLVLRQRIICGHFKFSTSELSQDSHYYWLVSMQMKMLISPLYYFLSHCLDPPILGFYFRRVLSWAFGIWYFVL